MSKDDRAHWDPRHADDGIAPLHDPPPPPPVFGHVDHLFPITGDALELACGRGRGGIWLASRGMKYLGVDVSPVAIDLATRLAEASGYAGRCRFAVWDLDDGLPPGPQVELVLCHLFRDPRLDEALVSRMKPGGLLAVAVLSEVGARPGRFRARPGELREAFGHLEVLDEGEADGMARILVRRD